MIINLIGAFNFYFTDPGMKTTSRISFYASVLPHGLQNAL